MKHQLAYNRSTLLLELGDAVAARETLERVHREAGAVFVGCLRFKRLVEEIDQGFGFVVAFEKIERPRLVVE